MVTSIQGDLREGMAGKMEDEGWMIKDGFRARARAGARASGYDQGGTWAW
jgi:hypothetical protein